MVKLAPVESGPDAAATGKTTAPAAAVPRKIIYKATVELATENLAAASRKVAEQVTAHGGYVAESSSGGTSGETREAHWKVRVPADRFDAFLAALGGVGETQSRHITSEDVSEEFYDVAARLKNKRVEEDRLIAHLKASGRLSDILLIEKEISRVREEVERMEGRLRFLANQTDLSTVEITLREIKGYRPEGPPSLATQARRTFGASLAGLAEFARALVLFVVALVPWAAVGGAVGVPLYLARRRRRAREATAKQRMIEREDSGR
jgi:hypothetical protein